ncbi:hypothetical protein JXB02_03960 [Candidatus Woesearchaeota archaeon]|nr:hypothetical protein [Candidatus Woesearchaeota archaeon]
MDNGKKNLPERKFKAGPVSAVVWLNQSVTKEGEVRGYATVSLERNYKDRDGEWQKTSSLRLSDLPKAALMLNKAFEYLVTKDQESGSSA